jgi:hypothetical protein
MMTMQRYSSSVIRDNEMAEPVDMPQSGVEPTLQSSHTGQPDTAVGDMTRPRQPHGDNTGTSQPTAAWYLTTPAAS